METGTVIRFTQTYGFIQRDIPEVSLFVHFSDIDQDGFKKFFPGDRVEFEIEATEREPKAVGVRRVEA